MIAGGAVGWYSKLQTIEALSTTEAEYIAAVEAGKEMAWMRNILSEFGYTCNQDLINLVTELKQLYIIR